MNEKQINEQHQYITRFIEQKRLREALTQLEPYLWQCTDWELRTRFEGIQTSYTYMLQYMRQGTADPERKKLYNKLLTETWEIADRARIALLDQVSPHYYHLCRTQHTGEIRPRDLQNLLHTLETFTEEIALRDLLHQDTEPILRQHEEAQKNIFQAVWTNISWNSKDETDAQDLLHSDLISASDQCLFASAVMLSLMQCLDMRKLMWLIDAMHHDNIRLSQRALVSFVLICHIYGSRLLLYPEFTGRLALLAENPSFARELNRIYVQLLLSQETEKIDRRMREEIIPEMMRNVSQLRSSKFGGEEGDEDKEDHNPDWAEAMEKAGLEDKLREINELQIEGADVYMSTFAHLKSYPFFREFSNWFYPFDKQHSSVVGQFRHQSDQPANVIDLILQSGFFCDSDKYSLCFTFMQMPESQREMMLNQLTDQQLNEMNEEQKSGHMKDFIARPETVSTQYIHDLYRFYKLNSRRREFHDIFADKLLLHRNPVLRGFLFQPERLAAIAEFHFRKKHYAEAATVYADLLSLSPGDAEIYQKRGYSLQKEKKYDQAIAAYLKADMLKPDHVWTNRHLATCYRLSGDFEQALAYYRKVEEVQPENTQVLYCIGSCLTELGRDEEALNHFFKLDFLKPDSIKVWRAIGWCSFVSGKNEQAARYYDKVIATHPTAVDYLNAGHIAWSMGNTEKAIEMYSKAILTGMEKEQFLELFYKDKPVLLEQGIQEDDIPLMLDLL